MFKVDSFFCLNGRDPSLNLPVFHNSVKFLNVKHVDCNPGYMFVFTATPYNVLLLRNKCLNSTVFIVLMGVTHVFFYLCRNCLNNVTLTLIQHEQR